MDNPRPAAIMRPKQTLVLILTLLLALYSRPCPDFTFYYLWCYPLLGALAVWLTMDITGLRYHPFWAKYYLSPEVAALGLGGPVAGLPLVVMILYNVTQMSLIQPDNIFDSGQCMRLVLFTGAEVMGCGQALWVLWLVAGFKILWHETPRMINIGNVFQDLALVFCFIFHIPFLNMATGIFIYPITLFLTNMIGISLGCD